MAEHVIHGGKLYRVADKPKTLQEKLRECSNCINEIEEYVGAEYIAGFQRQLADAVMDVLLEHFQLSEFELEAGTLTLKSDNSTHNTVVRVSDVTLDNITKIEWTLDAEDQHGKLHLTLM